MWESLDGFAGVALAIALAVALMGILVLAVQLLGKVVPGRVVEWVQKLDRSPFGAMFFFPAFGGWFLIWIYVLLAVFGGDPSLRISTAYGRVAGLFAWLGGSPLMAALGSAASFVFLVLVPSISGCLQLAGYAKRVAARLPR